MPACFNVAYLFLRVDQIEDLSAAEQTKGLSASSLKRAGTRRSRESF
jgi:hypothetical protein